MDVACHIGRAFGFEYRAELLESSDRDMKGRIEYLRKAIVEYKKSIDFYESARRCERIIERLENILRNGSNERR
mgnify:CR=1 FL=1